MSCVQGNKHIKKWNRVDSGHRAKSYFEMSDDFHGYLELNFQLVKGN